MLLLLDELGNSLLVYFSLLQNRSTVVKSVDIVDE